MKELLCNLFALCCSLIWNFNEVQSQSKCHMRQYLGARLLWKGLKKISISLSVQGQKLLGSVFFTELGHCFIAGQRYQSDSRRFTINKTEPIIDARNKSCCIVCLGEGNMPRCKSVKFDDISVSDIPLKLKRPSTSVEEIFNSKPATEPLKWWKRFNILKNGDATVLDIIRLSAIIMEAVKFSNKI